MCPNCLSQLHPGYGLSPYWPAGDGKSSGRYGELFVVGSHTTSSMFNFHTMSRKFDGEFLDSQNYHPRWQQSVLSLGHLPCLKINKSLTDYHE